MLLNVPERIVRVAKALEGAGFEAYLVGGCVRDLLLSREPKDWDITTNARPEEIQALFLKTFYENEYGTVGVVIENESGSHVTNNYVSHEKESSVTRESKNEIVEVTPYRIEGAYSDYRRPDEVRFSNKLEDDLKRRDFTINALAFSVSKGHLIDIYKGQDDLKAELLRAVGKPAERFREDALRMLRAVRLSAELGFTLEQETQQAIFENATLLKEISMERINDEFNKILMSDNPGPALQICHQLGLLHYFLPELEEGIGVEQRGEHLYDVWEHNLRSLQHAANRGWSFHVRLAALLHDVAKPHTKVRDEKRQIWTFHGHDVVGARMAKKIMERMKYSRDVIEVVTKLVRYHLFFSDVDVITLSAVRRMVRNVGHEHIWDLMKVRACDRIGTGRPKEAPYRLRKYEAMIEEAMRAPLTVGMLKIDGKRLMQVTGERPGPKIGLLLHALLEEVLDNPELNSDDYLEKRAQFLIKMPEEQLIKLGEQGKEKKLGLEQEEIEGIRKRHRVA